MIKQSLWRGLQEALTTIGVEVPLVLETPKDSRHGDFATPIAFGLAKSLKQNPSVIAMTLLDRLKELPAIGQWAECEVVGGFINFRLRSDTLWRFLKNLEVSHPTSLSSDRILIEYVSANPTGPLHIGHGRWAVVGDVLARLWRHVGYNVSTEFYINDSGNQVANFRRSVVALRENQPIHEEGYHGAYLQDLAMALGDPVETMLAWQKETLSRLGVVFDTWFSETTLHESGAVLSCLAQLKQKDLVYEKDHALWFAATRHGDEKDRVVVKADGNLTYFACDIAYHCQKIDRGFLRLVNIWGADHHGYVSRLRSAIASLRGDDYLDPTHFQVVLGQLVSLFRGGEPVKMSKRTGEMITLDEVMDDIGVDATRFFLVLKNPDLHLDFDLELAKKKSAENPVYYVQYAHARIMGILEKLGMDPNKAVVCETMPTDLLPEERALIFRLVQIHDDLAEAAQLAAVHRLATDVIGIAKTFHLFYEACPLLKADKDRQVFRAYLLQKTAFALRLYLSLLGVSAPVRM